MTIVFLLIVTGTVIDGVSSAEPSGYKTIPTNQPQHNNEHLEMKKSII